MDLAASEPTISRHTHDKEPSIRNRSFSMVQIRKISQIKSFLCKYPAITAITDYMWSYCSFCVQIILIAEKKYFRETLKEIFKRRNF